MMTKYLISSIKRGEPQIDSMSREDNVLLVDFGFGTDRIRVVREENLCSYNYI